MEFAFAKLKECGWLEKLMPSDIIESEITNFEKKQHLNFPAIFKAYLQSYKRDSDDIVGITFDYREDELKIKLISLFNFTYDISELTEVLKQFRNEFKEWEVPPDKKIYKNLFPIGYSDGGLCLDLSRSDGEDCPVIYLEYGGFWQENGYYDAEGILHGELAAPDFCTFLNWYFCGELEEKFGKQNCVKVNREFYNKWIEKNFITNL